MSSPHGSHDPYVRVRGAREHNLRGVDVDVPRVLRLAQQSREGLMKRTNHQMDLLG